MQRHKNNDTSYIQKIEYVFYNAADIRMAVTEARRKERFDELELRNVSKISDPTAAEAIRNLMPVKAVIVREKVLNEPESWLEVVDKTYSWCIRRGEIYHEICVRRYCGEYFAKICARLELSVDSFYRILDKIRNYAAIQAAYRRLIYVD